MLPNFRRVIVILFIILPTLVVLLLVARQPKSIPCDDLLNRETLYPLTPTPPSPGTISGKLELFWNIRVEVNCGEIQVYKEISIWKIDPSSIQQRAWFKNLKS